MKRIFLVFITILLFFGLAGQSMGAFSPYQLIRVVYDTNYDGQGNPTGGTSETATDLGAVSALIAGGTNQVVGGGANNFAQYSGTTWSSLRVGYFAIGNSTDKDVWVSASSVPTSGTRRFTPVQTEMTQVFTYYGGATAPATVNVVQSYTNSYWNLLNDASLGIGKFNSFITQNIGETSLADLATQGFVDQKLYFFDSGDSAATGVEVATIRTMANGSTIINPVTATVPDAPTIGTATAGNGQATVTFTTPASDGGSPILSYTATSTPGNITGTCAGASCTSITVTGLTNGTAYTFTVTARNSVGSSLPSAVSNSVTPTAGATAPGAPTIGTATAGNGQATVTFTAPVNNGGSAIIDYTVTSNPGGFTQTGAASPITVTGLTNGTAYTFTVTARNSVDSGPPSAPSNSVTPTAGATAPGAPTIGTATAGNAQATVTFTAPASDGGSTITSYTVTSTPGNISATGSASPITMTGLTNGTAYTFKVKATNAIGTGPESAASNSVTPTAPTITISPSKGTLGTAIVITGPAGSFGDKKGKVLIDGVNAVKLDKDIGWSDTRISGTIKKVILPVVDAYNVTISSKDMAADINLEDAFTFKDPESLYFYPLGVDHGKTGDKITIKGSFFGVKKGKIYIETAPEKKKKCKIERNTWSMDPTTGESEVTFVVPKGIASSLLPYPLKLVNKVGFAETFFAIDF